MMLTYSTACMRDDISHFRGDNDKDFPRKRFRSKALNLTVTYGLKQNGNDSNLFTNALIASEP